MAGTTKTVITLHIIPKRDVVIFKIIFPASPDLSAILSITLKISPTVAAITLHKKISLILERAKDILCQKVAFPPSNLILVV